MIPGCVTHVVFYGFISTYSPADRIHEGGGLVEEGEDIEVVELTIDKAMEMVFYKGRDSFVDVKTIMLL